MVIKIDNELLKITHDYIKYMCRKSSQTNNVEIEKLRDFYTCPDECGNLCCKNIHFGLSNIDVKNISKSGTKGRDYIRKIQKSGKNCYSSLHNENFYSMEEEVCPFLNLRKCSLGGRYKPTICKQFPFVYSYEYKTPAVKMCPIGRDIAIDHNIASFLKSYDENPKNINQTVYESIEYFNKLCTMSEKDAFDEIVNTKMPNVPLNFLLCYLESTSLEDRILMRKSFLNGDLIEALKQYEHLIIWEINENGLILKDS